VRSNIVIQPEMLCQERYTLAQSDVRGFTIASESDLFANRP
jgi:hypothetical protein